MNKKYMKYLIVTIIILIVLIVFKYQYDLKTSAESIEYINNINNEIILNENHSFNAKNMQEQ